MICGTVRSAPPPGVPESMLVKFNVATQLFGMGNDTVGTCVAGTFDGHGVNGSVWGVTAVADTENVRRDKAGVEMEQDRTGKRTIESTP